MCATAYFIYTPIYIYTHTYIYKNIYTHSFCIFLYIHTRIVLSSWFLIATIPTQVLEEEEKGQLKQDQAIAS